MRAGAGPCRAPARPLGPHPPPIDADINLVPRPRPDWARGGPTATPDPHPPPSLSDKLAETKRAERERKEAHKAELAAAKAQKKAATGDAASLHRAERAAAHAGTARAKADERAAAHRDAHKAHAEEGACEHGVRHCKLCDGGERARDKKVGHRAGA